MNPNKMYRVITRAVMSLWNFHQCHCSQCQTTSFPLIDFLEDLFPSHLTLLPVFSILYWISYFLTPCDDFQFVSHSLYYTRIKCNDTRLLYKIDTVCLLTVVITTVAYIDHKLGRIIYFCMGTSSVSVF